mmetsp:Transcript_7013/g.15221  ORF Transcript_7013/g.15221 Transcript_7013/m.15221 type:complete len:203 (+) Transcript_7013:783-1391(+)
MWWERGGSGDRRGFQHGRHVTRPWRATAAVAPWRRGRARQACAKAHAPCAAATVSGRRGSAVAQGCRRTGPAVQCPAGTAPPSDPRLLRARRVIPLQVAHHGGLDLPQLLIAVVQLPEKELGRLRVDPRWLLTHGLRWPRHAGDLRAFVALQWPGCRCHLGTCAVATAASRVRGPGGQGDSRRLLRGLPRSRRRRWRRPRQG